MMRQPQVRQLMKGLLPAAAVDRWHERQNLEIYPSWEATRSAAKTLYDDADLTGFRIAHAKLNRKGKIRSEILLLCTGLLGGDIEITDFGGAAGEFGAAVKTEYPDVRYTVVENAAFAERARELENEIGFASAIPPSCDIFFSSCAIQYTSDPLGILEAGFRSARKLCILRRNSFCMREIFRVQRANLFDNGYGSIPPGFSNVKIQYPHRTIMEQAVMDLARGHGLRLMARMPDEDNGVLPYLGQVYGRTLVFAQGI